MTKLHSKRLRVRVRNAAAVVSLVALGAAVPGNAAAAAKPVNTKLPAISGLAREGSTITGTRGSWQNDPTDFTYVWRRCDGAEANCVTISGANALTYTLTAADVGRTVHLHVLASNGDGTTIASSAPTGVVTADTAAARQTNATPNQQPTIRILSVRFLGLRVYARMRVCDDSRTNLAIVERDSKPGVLSYGRRFATLTPPRPCLALTRSWLPAPRFRDGRYTISASARDRSGKTSLPARRTFFR